MVWEQQIEIVVCLLSDNEMGKGCIYWPSDKSNPLAVGDWLVALQSINVKQHSVERILTLTKHVIILRNDKKIYFY